MINENVVYLLIPTSNHNFSIFISILIGVVYLLISTSNHNYVMYGIMVSCVVYLLIPTSNHNAVWAKALRLAVVYLLIPTSNHNSPFRLLAYQKVVYLLIPTSNHNKRDPFVIGSALYIFWFLHQTTTLLVFQQFLKRCISFDSYIKPQLSVYPIFWYCVVYLLIPTSNHNSSIIFSSINMLYIFWFLHQTTTVICFWFSG